jgi:hypothetical protein
MTAIRHPNHRRLFVVMLTLGSAISSYTVLGRSSAQAQAADPAAALFADAQAVRANGQTDEAIGKYHRVMAEYPASVWAARSALESARSMVAQGEWAAAMRLMQDVYLGFPGTPEAAQAFERNTILHRLRLRQGPPVFRWARTAVNGSSSLRRVVGVAMDSKGRLYVATRQSLVLFNESGGLVRTEPADEPRSLTMRGDSPILLYERGPRQETGAFVPIMIPDQNRQREADVQAGAIVSDDGLLIADRRTKAIHRVSLNGTYQSRFTAIDAVRVAVGPQREVAAIERESNALWLIGADGRARTIPAAGAEYQLREPIEVAFDPLGHLYVLERDSVLVFAPTGEFLSLFAPGAVAGAFRMAVAFYVDAAGRLYIYDQDRELLQVFH